MNFNQLKYIVSVDKYRNFARAAENCGIAQSTLSKEIQRLEKEFEVMIFDRSRHPVVPTMKGIDLLRQAKIVLEEKEIFSEIANTKKNKPKGDFKLGILAALAPYLLPLFAEKLTDKFPELNLDIFELGPKEMANRFEDGDLDGAISIAPFYKEGLYERSLFEEEFVLYVGQNHYLSSFSRVKWIDIPFDELILQGDMKSYFSQGKSELFPVFSESKFKNINFQHSSLETIRKIIDRNGGITLIPQLACLYMGKRRLEMVRHIESPVLSRTISFVAPRGFQKKRISKVILPEIVRSIPHDYLLQMTRK